MALAAKSTKKSFGLKALFNRPAQPYVHPYLGGVILGIVLFLALFLTGNGFGSSGATSRLVVFVQDQFVPDHVDRTPYLLRMAGGDKNPLDDWLVLVFLERSWAGLLLD